MSNPADNPNFLNQLEQKMLHDSSKKEAVHELFSRGELTWMLHDGQREIAKRIEETDSNEILILCSRQFGKSFFSLVYTLMFLQKNPKTKAIIFAATNKQAVQITNDNMNMILRLAPPEFLVRRKTDRVWALSNGSELRIGSLEEADSSRGVNASLILMEEGAASCSSEIYAYALSSVIGPMLLRSKQAKLLHVTTPSKNLNHIVHTQILPKLDAKGAVARFTVYDNPQLSEAQIKEARARCLTEDDFEREYLCKIVKSQTLTVIPEFEEHLHLSPDLQVPEKAFWCLGLDLGGTVDKTALVLGYFDFRTNQRVIWDEAFLPINTASEQIVEAAKALLAKVPAGHEYSVTCDAPGQVRIDMSRLGLSTFLPRKGAGSFEAGISNVRYLFSKQELTIHPRCQNLIRTLKFAQFNKNRSDFQRTEELGHADMIAALMYQTRHQRTDNPFPLTHNLKRDTHFYDLQDKKTSDLELMLLG